MKGKNRSKYVDAFKKSEMFKMGFNPKDLLDWYRSNGDFLRSRHMVRLNSKIAQEEALKRKLYFERTITGKRTSLGGPGGCWYDSEEDYRRIIDVILPFYLELWEKCEGKLDIQPSGNNQD